jgi:hypothetical protein
MAKKRARKRVAKKTAKRRAHNFGSTRKTASGNESRKIENTAKKDGYILPHGYGVKHIIYKISAKKKK